MENLSTRDYRVGNIVRSKINGISKVEQIGSSINPEYIGGRSLEGNYWENSCLPVELTEQWLIDLGFEKVGSFFEKDWLILHKNIKTGTIDFLLNEPSSGKYHATILKYVHELQNLYFALTGEELEL